MDRARAYVAAATRSLALFEESPAKHALIVVADYMVHRDR